MKLPAGVVYSNYEPTVFSGLFMKGDTFTSDFYEEDLIGNIQHAGTTEFVNNAHAMEQGESVPLEFGVECREGSFDDSALYAVYEEQDLNTFISHLRANCKWI